MILPIQNSGVTDSVEEVADLLEIDQENRFRVRGYRLASRTMGGHSSGVEPWEEG
jgi:DNA polymerase/3'-5' exonuclease PolX